MGLGQMDEGLVMSFQIAHKRAIGFDDDVMLVAVIDYYSLLVPWMKL